MSLTQRATKRGGGRGLDKLLSVETTASPQPKEVSVSFDPSIRSFSRQRHCDAQFIQDTARPTLITQLQKKKVYDKICQWYETWTPAQQKVLLCGLTRICSTSQLESIATSIEPLFHSEVLQQRNTLRPLGRMKGVKKKTVGTDKKKKGMDSEAASPRSTPKGTPGGTPRGTPKGTPRGSPLHSPRPSPSPSRQLSPHPSKRASIGGVSHGLTPQGTPGGSLPGTPSPLPSPAQSVTPSIVFSEAGLGLEGLGMDGPEGIVGGIQTRGILGADGQYYDEHGNPINRRQSLSAGTNKKRKKVPVINVIPPMSDANLLRRKAKQKKLILVALEKRVSSWHHNALNGHVLTGLNPVTQSVGAIHSQHRSQPPSNISISQYFSEQDLGRSRVHARLLGTTSPLSMHGVTPVPKTSTNSKASLTSILTISQADKEKLSRIFKEQIGEIWQWLDIWKTYERLEFVNMIVKISSPPQLSYFAQCLWQRLQERVDITWLSDELLICIFQYLSVKDIFACSEVCRAWNLVASNEKLWKQKCRDMGKAHGIPQVTKLVRSMSPADELDWRIAYIELENNIAEQKRQQEIEAKRIEEIRRRKKERARAKSRSKSRSPGRGRRRPESAGSSILDEIPTNKEWRETIVQGPKLKLGKKLAEESAKLKEKYRQSVRAEKSHHVVYDLSDNDESREEFQAQRQRLSFKRACSISFPKRSSDKIISPMESFKSHHMDFTHRKSLSNFDDEQTEEALERPAEIVDLWYEVVQAIELLGKNSEAYLDSWIDLACLESDSVDGPKAGGITHIGGVRKLLSHTGPVQSFVYDKKRLISGGRDRSIRIWDFKARQCFHILQGHKGGVTSLLLDLNTLWSGSWDASIMVWDLRYFKRTTVLYGHCGSVVELLLWRRHVLSAGHDGTVRVWDADSYDCLEILELHDRAITTMVLDKAEDTIITGSSDYTIKITSLKAYEVLHTMTSHGPVNCLILQAGLVISTDVSGKVTFWNKYEGQSEAMIQCHDKQINSLGFRGSCFYTASDDWTIKEWDLYTLTCLRSLLGTRCKYWKIALESKFMLTSDDEGEIWYWDFVGEDEKKKKSEEELESIEDVLIPVKQLYEEELDDYCEKHKLQPFILEDNDGSEKGDKDEDIASQMDENEGLELNEPWLHQTESDINIDSQGNISNRRDTLRRDTLRRDTLQSQKLDTMDDGVNFEASQGFRFSPTRDSMDATGFRKTTKANNSPPENNMESDLEVESEVVINDDDEFAEVDINV